jgi:H+/Cl- antiporter ClcA
MPRYATPVPTLTPTDRILGFVKTFLKFLLIYILVDLAVLVLGIVLLGIGAWLWATSHTDGADGKPNESRRDAGIALMIIGGILAVIALLCCIFVWFGGGGGGDEEEADDDEW